MKVLSVVGNRPQFIKSAPLSLALREAGVDEVLLHSGQHYDAEMSQVFFDELGLAEPAYRLDLQSSDPNAMQPLIRDAIEREQPDWVIVFGDTNTTLAAARAAGQTPVAHVEAGLRSGDLSMPEENNRIEVDMLSRLLFPPDERSRETLERERVAGRTEIVGDVMRDALDLFAPIARARPTEHRGNYLLATVHREANVQPERLARIVEGLNRLDEPVLFPAHPRTAALVTGLGPHVEILPPAGYLEFLALASRARVIVTDSGGLQKEAYWLGVPCVTLRPSTEWIDTVETGANVLVDDDPGALERAVAAAHMPDERPELYGDGHAAGRIAAALYPSARE